MPLIYLPCIVVMLMVAARSPYFAAWHWPPLLAAIFLTVLLTTIYDYITLRRAAERVRAQSIETLQNTLVSLPNDDDRRRRLQVLIDQIKSITAGAFTTFSNNPVVGAVLLPFAGFGAGALVHLFAG
jgi:hypothetical protein